MPTQTKSSGLRERYSFLAYSGVKPGRSELGSARSPVWVFRPASWASVRCMIQTGLPRHSTVIIWPGAILVTSTSTGAPAARALADGAKELTKGTAVATPATPPTAQAEATQKRRDGSGGRLGSTAPESSSDVVI